MYRWQVLSQGQNIRHAWRLFTLSYWVLKGPGSLIEIMLKMFCMERTNNGIKAWSQGRGRPRQEDLKCKASIGCCSKALPQEKKNEFAFLLIVSVTKLSTNVSLRIFHRHYEQSMESEMKWSCRLSRWVCVYSQTSHTFIKGEKVLTCSSCNKYRSLVEFENEREFSYFNLITYCCK